MNNVTFEEEEEDVDVNEEDKEDEEDDDVVVEVAVVAVIAVEAEASEIGRLSIRSSFLPIHGRFISRGDASETESAVVGLQMRERGVCCLPERCSCSIEVGDKTGDGVSGGGLSVILSSLSFPALSQRDDA